MPPENKKLKICENGHRFYKSSECPTCPKCEEIKKPTDGFLSKLVAPARRAFENAGITTINQLAEYSEKDLLSLHGFGKSSIPVLTTELEKSGLKLKG